MSALGIRAARRVENEVKSRSPLDFARHGGMRLRDAAAIVCPIRSDTVEGVGAPEIIGMFQQMIVNLATKAGIGWNLRKNGGYQLFEPFGVLAMLRAMNLQCEHDANCIAAQLDFVKRIECTCGGGQSREKH